MSKWQCLRRSPFSATLQNFWFHRYFNPHASRIKVDTTHPPKNGLPPAQERDWRAQDWPLTTAQDVVLSCRLSAGLVSCTGWSDMWMIIMTIFSPIVTKVAARCSTFTTAAAMLRLLQCQAYDHGLCFSMSFSHDSAVRKLGGRSAASHGATISWTKAPVDGVYVQKPPVTKNWQ